MSYFSPSLYIVCTIDNAYIQHCAVMLYSLFLHNPEQQFQIFILSEGLVPTQKNKLKNYILSFQQEIEFIKIDTDKLRNAPISLHISLATYYRLLIPQTLPASIDKVLFLDADIVIKSNIERLWQLFDNKYAIMAAPDPQGELRKKHLNIPRDMPYFNAGILLINLKKWRKEKISEEIISYINKNHKKLKYWDQDALNACLYDDVKIISRKWNVVEEYFRLSAKDLNIATVEYQEITNHPAIIHFTSPRKPWHLESTHLLRREYRYCLRQTPWKNYSYQKDLLQRFLKNPRSVIKLVIKKLLSYVLLVNNDKNIY